MPQLHASSTFPYNGRMPADAIHLELLGDSPWWIAIATVAGSSMLFYALLGARRGQPAGSAPAMPLLWNVPLPRIAFAAGIAALLLTAMVAWATGSTSLAVPALLLLLLSTAVTLFYRGVYGALTPGRRIALVFLRVAGMAALVLLLFRPVLAIVNSAGDARPGLRIIVDASATMSYNDAPNQPSRFRQSVIAIESTLVPRLEKTYRIELFAYDGTRTTVLSGPAELESILPDGAVTDLGAALSLRSPDDATEAATILFSDGIHNGPVNVQAVASGIAGGAIHTVRVGSSELEPSTVPDIAVVSIDGPRTAIIKNQVTLNVTIRSTAMNDRTVLVQLESADGAPRVIEEQRLVLRSGGGAGQTVQMRFTPEAVGRATVRVQVPVDPAERSDANNQQDFSMLVTDPKLGLLYVEGRVRPEVGPLRRTFEQDANLAAVSLVQTVAGRFEMSGVPPTADLKGLPTSLAQWQRFKVIVLGDLDASFLNEQQQKDLEQAVRDGAGLLMIGGQNSFAPGGWEKTTLASLLPVTLEKVTPAQINTPFVPQLTPIGEAHPIFRNISGYFPTASRSTPEKTDPALPDLTGCVALGSAKPGASILAVHPKERVNNQAAIVLAVQQYGKGRTAAFAGDTTFHWNRVMRGLQQESPYNRFWGQMVRWLASEEGSEKKTGASVTAMMTKERFQPDEPVLLRAAVTGSDGRAMTGAQVWADVTGPDGKTTRVPLVGTETTANDGMYQSSRGTEGYKPAMAGKYEVTFGASSRDNLPLGADKASFTVLPAAGERDVLAAQPQTLATISQQTRGTSIDLPSLPALTERLLAAAPPPRAAATTLIPMSHPRGFFLVFIGCLALEWFLRRRWQLQ